MSLALALIVFTAATSCSAEPVVVSFKTASSRSCHVGVENDTKSAILIILQDIVVPDLNRRSAGYIPHMSIESSLIYTEHRIEVEGVRWTRFWWYTPINGWPSGETDVLGADYGTCLEDAVFCFSRLPGALQEKDAELLAVDSSGTIYKWMFDPANPTAHAAWNAFYHNLDQGISNSLPWTPTVIAGNPPLVTQDSFQYRSQYGVRSVLLDDDNCDCYSTLSMGHGMCGAGFVTSYGPAQRFGVDLLHDPECETPDPRHGLSLYFRDNDDCIGNPCPGNQGCADGVNAYTCA